MFSVTKVFLEDEQAVFHLKGYLDSLSAPFLSEEIAESMPDMDSLVFDCKELEYISSSAFRVLLTARMMFGHGERFKLRNVNENVRDILDVAGLSDVLTIE